MMKYRVLIKHTPIWDFETEVDANKLKARLQIAGVTDVKIRPICFPEVKIGLPNRGDWEYPQSEVKNG